MCTWAGWLCWNALTERVTLPEGGGPVPILRPFTQSVRKLKKKILALVEKPSRKESTN